MSHPTTSQYRESVTVDGSIIIYCEWGVDKEKNSDRLTVDLKYKENKIFVDRNIIIYLIK